MAQTMAVVASYSETIRDISRRGLSLLILPGPATGASWLSYFKAIRSKGAGYALPTRMMMCSITRRETSMPVQSSMFSVWALALTSHTSGPSLP